MFRKLIHLILVFIVVLATSGVTITKHYCGDKLDSIAVNTIHKSCCGDNCPFCHNVTHNFKVKDDFFVSDFKIDSSKVLHLNWMTFPAYTVLSFVSNPFSEKKNFPPLILQIKPDTSLSLLQEFRC